MSVTWEAPRCAACGRSSDDHSLDEARACIAELAKREPPYCRLTGPRDPAAFARAVSGAPAQRLADQYDVDAARDRLARDAERAR